MTSPIPEHHQPVRTTLSSGPHICLALCSLTLSRRENCTANRLVLHLVLNNNNHHQYHYYYYQKIRVVLLLQKEEAHVFSPCCIKHQKSSVLSLKTLQLALEWPVTTRYQCNLQAPRKRTSKSAFLVALSPRHLWQESDSGPGMSGMCIPGLFWEMPCRQLILFFPEEYSYITVLILSSGGNNIC